MKNNRFHSANALLDAKYGKEGTEKRAEFNEKATAYYYGVMLRDKRKELHITQNQLAEKSGTTRSYIARIEKGETDMQVSTFVKLLTALGLQINIASLV